MAIITDGVKTKFTDDNGLPLIGGQVFSYVEGTSTPKDTYQDRAFTIPNTNPIILDDVGSCQMYLKGGYRLRVLTADGVLVEEKDNAFQSDGQVLDVVANTTAIAALQTNVDVLNTRGGLKTDEHNHVIGQGKAESATVYDLSLRSDKVRVSAPTDVEFGNLLAKTYVTPTVVNGVTMPIGTWLNPELLTPIFGAAASKSIGTAAGQIPLANKARLAASMPDVSRATVTDVNNLVGTDMTLIANSVPNAPMPISGSSSQFVESLQIESSGRVWQFAYASHSPEIQMRMRVTSTNVFSAWVRLYHTGNTAKESSTGYLVASSPVLNVQHDSFEKIHEAEKLEIEVKNIKTGVYEITGTTGLREGDGWNLKPPKDVNGNVLCVCEATEKDGVITLNTYAKRFDFETVSIVADYDKPLNIPEGATVMLRFNDLPQGK